MIIAGAALIMMVLDRLPILVWLGATLLGWIAGDVIATDPAVHPLLQRLLDGQIGAQSRRDLGGLSAVAALQPGRQIWSNISPRVLGAIAVLVVGSIWRKRRLRQLRTSGVAGSGRTGRSPAVSVQRVARMA